MSGDCYTDVHMYNHSGVSGCGYRRDGCGHTWHIPRVCVQVCRELKDWLRWPPVARPAWPGPPELPRGGECYHGPK